jgi:hypothetical protein
MTRKIAARESPSFRTLRRGRREQTQKKAGWDPFDPAALEL